MYSRSNVIQHYFMKLGIVIINNYGKSLVVERCPQSEWVHIWHSTSFAKYINLHKKNKHQQNGRWVDSSRAMVPI